MRFKCFEIEKFKSFRVRKDSRVHTLKRRGVSAIFCVMGPQFFFNINITQNSQVLRLNFCVISSFTIMRNAEKFCVMVDPLAWCIEGNIIPPSLLCMIRMVRISRNGFKLSAFCANANRHFGKAGRFLIYLSKIVWWTKDIEWHYVHVKWCEIFLNFELKFHFFLEF